MADDEEDYGGEEFDEGDEDYVADRDKHADEEANNAATKVQAQVRGQSARKKVIKNKLPDDFVPAETLAAGPAVANAVAGGGASAMGPRSRSRVRMTSKGITPSEGLVPLSARRSHLLPAIGQAGSSSAIVPQAVAEEEVMASEQLSVAVNAEMQAQEHLRRVRARVQRELRRAASLSAIQKAKEDKLEMSRKIRADMDKKVGRDLIKQIAASDIPPASDEEIKKMSELLNKMLEMYHPDARNFFALFKHIDVDGSRRVSFNELARLIREELRIKKSELPEPRLHALWRHLDENGSGFVDPGELGRFMKIGAPEGGLGARARMLIKNQEQKKKQQLEMDKKSGKHLAQLIREQKVEVDPASDEEVAHYSALFNQQMIALRGREGTNGQNFYRLFKAMDIDGSGRITFNELAKMVRIELKLTKAELPKEKLMGLWKVLDDNESGFICAGEFGRFMNLKGAAVVPNVIADIREKQRETVATDRLRASALWKEQAADRANAEARRLAREAAELEAMLNAATGGSGSLLARSTSLPQIGSGRINQPAVEQLKSKLGLEGSGERRAKPKVVMDRVANGGRQGGKGESLLGAVVRPAAANPNPTL